MKIEITNERLYAYHQELLKYSGNSIIGLLLKTRINSFYKDNGIRIDTLINKLKGINKKYLVLDEKDGIVWEEVGEDKAKKPKMLLGMKYDDFEEEVKKLQQTVVTINI